MPNFRPKFISFDCYGTLTRFRMTEMATAFMADRIDAEKLPAFCKDWGAYRFDQVMGAWEPYQEIIRNSLRRTCEKWGVAYNEADADAVYNAVPTWGPHDDVAGGLSKIGDKIPLVILSNAMNDQIHHNVGMLGAPFHAVYTAQMAQAYKPRMQAFEYMFDQLGANPEDMMHVSSSFRYDQNTATDLHFGCRVFVGRGHEPSNPFYRDVEIPHIGCLPAVVGL
ncbi:haloacid dehalogenase type II [Sphingobium sp. SA2]|jgi:2-haloacid dehalogenase|uniref:haloacid dehalogenase type II n=1 Tax=unclassified Sphingobium TaxID=2611147 RepID=UPI00083CB9AA|nr:MULTISPECIES: haloacid dehalogenase type II [unclassified Sphingobium]AOF95072.1 haloacid dehalogenase, type II [Sphingobium sp. RAC03]MDT7532363.1 haloacid dehalogenase type II [Sphingobium sp. SA2]|tara:strand:+ start:1068 stop:1736 length:669 start_codon:yes stop_codon:yes gene_type:complete